MGNNFNNSLWFPFWQDTPPDVKEKPENESDSKDIKNTIINSFLSDRKPPPLLLPLSSSNKEEAVTGEPSQGVNLHIEDVLKSEEVSRSL